MMEGSTDSFGGNEWELSKENVQPLKKGRKMANLTAALAPSSVDQSRIYQEKQEFEAQIRTYEGDDPLEIWYRYIVWTSENFPKGGKDLGNLLERCMTTFKDQERYRNDERYAKVWLNYTDICTDPVEIFQYMHSQQLCSGLALFFESWAQLLEGLGDYKKADEVFILGIQKNAQPLERLKRQHRAFELRITESVANGLEQVSMGDASEPKRVSLGGLKRQGKKGTVGTQRTGNAKAKRSGIASFALPESQTKNAAFKIFCDDDPSACSSLPPSTGEWQMPPTQHVIKRENTQKPGKWTDMKISQRNHTSIPLSGIPQKPEFSVHVDEDVVNCPPPTLQDMHFNKVLSARKPNKSFVTETLQNKTEDQTTRVMYCKEKIYAGTEEFSFEELRAARIFQKIKEGTHIPQDTPVPPQNVRYMYPKKEVYSFEGEFQYEEILARRYYSRLKEQDVSTRHTSQENFVQAKITGFASNDQACPMEIGSCQKSVIPEAPSSSHANEIAYSMSVTQNSLASTARRGLSFANQPLIHLPPEASSSTRLGPSFTAQPSIQQGGCTKSAFHPVGRGLCIRGDQDDMVSRQQNSINPQQRNNLFDMSSCNDTENVFTKPDKQIGISESLAQKIKLCEQIASTNKMIAGSKLGAPDANRSCEFNTSNITSPTVFTKEALMELGDMFRLPLESERRSESEDQAENDFEAAFSGDSAAPTHSVAFGAQGGSESDPGFVIYTDVSSISQNTGEVESKEDDTEDKENMPPSGRREESVNRPLAGILQPSVGIPFCPLDTEDDYDEEPIGVEDRDDFNTQHKKYQEDKTSELSLAEYSHDQTAFTCTSFATAARMASTPFSCGIGPSPLPNIPCSTIRLADGNPAFVPDDDVFCSAHVTSSQATGSFTSPPSKVLSPILEGSHEDSKSTNSSQSSVGSSRPGSCSAIVSQQNGLELSRIQEEPSFHETASAPQDTKTGMPVINPFSGEVVDGLLRKITPPLSCYFGFSESSEEMPKIATKGSVCFGKDASYFVERQLGSGAFAKVYLVTTRDTESDRDDVETDDESRVVLKVQKISIEWEFYISRQLHSRMQDLGCSKVLHEMIMNPLAAYVYSNSSVLVDTYEPLGTVLRMVNNYKSNKRKMDEGVMFFYTIALLRILETLHYCDIIHGDIKPDNFLVLDCDVPTPDGAPLRIIDFGRSIDMRLFPTGTTFTTDCHTDGFQCVEMKEGRPWTKQIDTYGILGTIHCLLFLDYMKVYKDAHGKWKITKAFCRHWNPVWSKLFNSLLNITSCEEQPSLRDFREEFERLYRMDGENYTCQKRAHDVFMFSCNV